MALPKVSILFENGALAGVAPDADGIAGLVVAGVAKAATDTKKAFELNKAYLLRRLSDLTDMNVTSAVNDGNALAYRHVKAFFDEAGDGAELWLMCLAQAAAHRQRGRRAGKCRQRLCWQCGSLESRR
jgi:hypothetical protein